MLTFIKKEYDEAVSDKNTKLDYLFIALTAAFAIITAILVIFV